MPGWIYKNGPLTQEEMENNATIVAGYYKGLGINDVAIAAILGNMQAESTINPTRGEIGGSGYGLVQWTPKSKLIEQCNLAGLSPPEDGDVQTEVVRQGILGMNGIAVWYSSEPFISRYYSSGATPDMIGITGEEFLSNARNFSVDKMAIVFMVCYERPSYDPNTNHYTDRMTYAHNWLDFIGGVSPDPGGDDDDDDDSRKKSKIWQWIRYHY